MKKKTSTTQKLVSRKEIAYFLGVTERTIAEWRNLDDPIPVEKIGKGRAGNEYDPKKVIQWYVNKKLSQVTNYVDERLNLDKEKARLAKEQADNTALKNAQLRKEMAPIELISFVLAQAGAQISAQLETIPGKVKKRVPELKTAQIEIIKREIVKAQNTAAKIEIDLDEYDPD